MPRTTLLPMLLAGSSVLGACAGDRGTSEPRAIIDADSVDAESVDVVLRTLHQSASKPDPETYWSLYAPDAIFLGTDASERWTLDQFKAYATPYFEKGQGWTYSPTSRFIAIGANGRTAWFDEALVNAKYGPCRGTGVLVRTSHGWKIAQYNLTVPIPNDLLADVARQIREFEARK